MNAQLSNECLTVTVAQKGAELISVTDENGCEYLWQADDRYWGEHAPWMFPVCGRFFGGHYTYEGKTYEMPIHGFARTEDFRLEEQTENTLSFVLTENERTLAMYPFPFSLRVTYTLSGKKLSATATVRNTGKAVLPATLGVHPGFCLPLGESSFEDHVLVFDAPCKPRLFVLSPSCFLSGEQTDFPLENGISLPLRRSLFDNDAIFVSDMADRVTLMSTASERKVTVHYPDVPYLGFWQKPHSDAPYLCIEPWYGLPSLDGAVEDLSEKPHMFRLSQGEEASMRCEILFE